MVVSGFKMVGLLHRNRLIVVIGFRYPLHMVGILTLLKNRTLRVIVIYLEDFCMVSSLVLIDVLGSERAFINSTDLFYSFLIRLFGLRCKSSIIRI